MSIYIFCHLPPFCTIMFVFHCKVLCYLNWKLMQNIVMQESGKMFWMFRHLDWIWTRPTLCLWSLALQSCCQLLMKKPAWTFKYISQRSFPNNMLIKVKLVSGHSGLTGLPLIEWERIKTWPCLAPSATPPLSFYRGFPLYRLLCPSSSSLMICLVKNVKYWNEDDIVG